MTDLFNKTVTVYNDIPADGINPRSWHRAVVNDCNVQGQTVEKMQGTTRVVVNVKTVIFKDKSNYVPALDFSALPQDKRDGKFTMRTGDFIVFGEVSDVVTTSQDFATLQRKYKDNGMLVNTVSDYSYGMNVDNLTVTS